MTTSEIQRFIAIRPAKHIAPEAEDACGNCIHLVPDYSHPITDGLPMSHQRGWICQAPGLGSSSGWNPDGLCELHEKIAEETLSILRTMEQPAKASVTEKQRLGRGNRFVH